MQDDYPQYKEPQTPDPKKITRRHFLISQGVAAAGLGIYLMFGGDSSTPLNGDFSPENMAKLYGTLEREIKSIFDTAKRQGKKPLLVVGDCHESDESFMIEAMMLNIVKDLIPQRGTLYVERTESCLIQEFNRPEQFGAKDNVTKMARYSRNALNFRVMPIDNDADEAKIVALSNSGATEEMLKAKIEETQDSRDKTMAYKIMKDGNPGIVLCGSAHMKGIMTDVQKSNEYLIGAMNVGHLNHSQASNIDGKLYPKGKAAFLYAADPKNAAQMTVQYYEDAPRMSTDEMIQKVRAGISQHKKTQVAQR